MSKYYTPEIEEFHVGFEYETLELREWLKSKILIGHNIAYIEDMRVKTRVKYLDREDIESLGFKRDLMRGNNVFSKSHPKNKSIITTLRTYFEMDKGRVTLSSNARMFIDIDLKNKSELKKLLKQLGI